MADLPVDVKALDSDTRKALSAACDAEDARLNILASMPSQAAFCCYQYQVAGGNPQDIADAVQAWVDDHQEDTK